jgi:hypothetical protein
MLRALTLLALAAPLAGCLTHMPAEGPNAAHMAIRWRPGFEAACAEARDTRRPILLVTAAGDITGRC